MSLSVTFRCAPCLPRLQTLSGAPRAEHWAKRHFRAPGICDTRYRTPQRLVRGKTSPQRRLWPAEDIRLFQWDVPAARPLMHFKLRPWRVLGEQRPLATQHEQHR